VTFPYSLERAAPASAARAFMDDDCTFVALANGNHEDFILGVRVPVTSHFFRSAAPAVHAPSGRRDWPTGMALHLETARTVHFLFRQLFQ
jgi:hypothetical protein